MNSLFLKLNLSDFGKGAILAVIVAVVGGIHQLLQTQGFDLSLADLQAIGELAIKVFIAYLAKNLLSNSEGKFGKAE